MKIAPLMAALGRPESGIHARLVHTGQHYDPAMNDAFFASLGIPAPDINLDVGSASHAVQTAEILKRFEPVLDQEQPVAVLVVGDVNSTIACALAAAKKGVAVIHVEAGLRSYDRTMPEEINRVLTDQISDLLFITERSARANLVREGIPESAIHFVGNVMIDTLHANLTRAVPAATTLAAHAPQIDSTQGFAVLTLHRPSNVDDAATLRRLIETLAEIGARLPIVFPMHPRTAAKIEAFHLEAELDKAGVTRLPALGYLEMLGLMRDARVVLTDSGGIQEETTALGVPCITLRDNTERPITIDEGTNILAGCDAQKILAAFDEVMTSGGKRGRIPEYWDGHAATRIVEVLQHWLNGGLNRRVA